MRRCVAVLVTASVVSSAVWAATRPSIPSAWRTADIQIDGNDAEWTSTLAAVPAPSAVASMSVENDATHVFVRIRTTDPATMQQIVRGGLLVWFDAKGGDAKTFGIKYPVGTPPPNPDADQRPTRDREQADSGGQRRPGRPCARLATGVVRARRPKTCSPWCRTGSRSMVRRTMTSGHSSWRTRRDCRCRWRVPRMGWCTS